MDTGRPTWRSRAWLVAATVLLVLALGFGMVATPVPSGMDRPAAAWGAVVVAVAVAVSVLGWAVLRTGAQRSRYDDELAAWAAERATQNERLRIASDLHDLVSHGLGLITVRAAVARTITGPGGDTERSDALADIEHASRGTTTELRRMLTVLRDPGAPPLRPADTLTDLPAIIRAATAAGLTATLGLDELGEVSPGVQLTVCTVVREGLNNTIRHAGPTRVHVCLRRDGESIIVDVQDTGPRAPWQPRPGAGHGLDGLRERVSVLGGALRAEAAEGGFRLTARLPDRDRNQNQNRDRP